MQKDNNMEDTQKKVSEVVHQCGAMGLKIRVIEIAYLSVSLIEVVQSTEESNRLEANWEVHKGLQKFFHPGSFKRLG